jgi:phospholipase C
MEQVSWTRRKFLAAGAGLVAGAACAGGSKSPAPAKNAAPNVAPFGQFDHLVVLMFENRSFDNMLGYLYQPNEVPRNQQFNGVAGKDLFNVAPDGTKVSVAPGTVMDNPNPDPGEEYPHINTDFFNTVIPPSNAVQPVKDMVAPFNAPTPIPVPAPMSGFVHDYMNRITGAKGTVPTPAEYGIIMNCYPPDAVPVISQLAKGFAVADSWFCEVPSQTFCNRSFFHAATSSGFTSNEPYEQFPFFNGATTVFDRLNQGKVTWRGYYDKRQLLPLTFLIHFPRLMNDLGSNFFTMDRFFNDVTGGTLPQYSFIEPNMLVNHNDEHPPAAVIGTFIPPSNVLAGEALLASVYNAIKNSKSTTGSNSTNTALLITYDEGGGCYDHVSPPAAPTVPPGPNGNEEGFAFDRLGERVPAVLVSAHTEAGTVVNTPMHHTSAIRTMSEKWNLAPLTARDQNAPDMAPFFNLKNPRPAGAWPTVTPRPVPLVSDTDALAELLNELQRDLIGAADAVRGTPNPTAVNNLKTVGDGVAYVRQKYPDLPH